MNKKGVSLVETLIVVSIFSMMIAGLYTTLTAGNRSWQSSENGVMIVRSARNAIWVMTKDLRNAEGPSITQSSSAVTFVFNHPTIGTITYSWTNTGANANKLIRQTSTRTRTLATNITALTFTDQGTSILVNLTVTRTPEVGSTGSMNIVQEVTYR